MDFFKMLDKNDVKELEIFLQSTDVNTEINDYSLLYWAVHHNNLDFVKTLVKHGAEINWSANFGRTPLLIACFYGFHDIAEFLLERGANTEGCLERAEHGWDGHYQEDVIKLLNQYNA